MDAWLPSALSGGTLLLVLRLMLVDLADIRRMIQQHLSDHVKAGLEK